jgi:hypothetical protein
VRHSPPTISGVASFTYASSLESRAMTRGSGERLRQATRSWPTLIRSIDASGEYRALA